MKKLLFIFPIAVVMLVLQGCFPDWDPDDMSYNFYLESPKDFIKISPKKDTYKVGDTINITYNIPSKLGAHAKQPTKGNIIKYLGIPVEEFDLHALSFPNYKDSIRHSTPSFLCKYKKEDWCRDTSKTISWASINGKEMKDWASAYYIYDETTKNYTLKVQVVFSKPDIIYFDVKEREKNLRIISTWMTHHSIKAQKLPKTAHYVNIYFYPPGHYAKDDIAFKVVE
ncbi:Uncharacterised protein [Candidatus Ornithobacterium hominis]|uniref:NigD-like protein n=1 Tax=Candidatus Ornithobacterium hominis TaxID=2497989 RepID=A0A383TVK6_9FLAO|nr:hypothetical protein [Candidatus Ornithobacterium hominis]MCT7904480.1 hypothetical protein [Candidatus Ornithobacterium hominis]SZD71377.1 Uncharacterised protein [Candidatus Ornithobacterium hominis]